MAVTTYDPGQVEIIFGPVRLSGFAEDSLVSIEKNNPRFTLKVGVDGHGTRSRSHDESAKVKVSLMQSSMSNDLLSGIAQLDRRSGQGVFPLLIKDLSGRSLFTAATAWLEGDPTVEFGKEVGTREWTIETDQLESLIMGN